MKQKITKEQWLEITDEQSNHFMHIKHKVVRMMPSTYPTIGQMIEFLDNGNKYNFWDERFENRKIDEKGLNISWEGELCDGLWEAVKKKLNN